MLNRIRTTNALAWRPTLSSQQFTLMLSMFLVLMYNQRLWNTLSGITGTNSFNSVAFLASFFLLIVALFNLLLTLVSLKHVQKPLAIFIVISASLVAYFMSSYSIMIDKTMVQNLFETDPAEAKDLININMLLNTAVFGLLPALMILRTRITYRPFFSDLKLRLFSVILSLVMVAGVLGIFYKDYSSTLRNNRQIRHLIVPSNYLYYSARYLAGAYEQRDIKVESLESDAKLAPIWRAQPKKVVTIVVVGETARSMNFSLNGYPRQTNPELSQLDLFNFTNMYSCGTSTAVSLPCMFANIGRDNYSSEYARSHENVLDVIAHAGVSVLWRDNNSGCKGVCDRVDQQSLPTFKDESLCVEDECFDEGMLNNLDAYLDNADNNAVIVLHQKGSHGPAYSLRYPKAFKQFTPVCDSSDLPSCSQQQIVNAYDNTILYTDHFLARVIDFLQQRSERYTTAMLYISDHGESLGENNLYLHGLPYFFAPQGQKHVPFFSWLSPDYLQNFQLDADCLTKKTSDSFSHDNLFHSLLGLMAVETTVYRPELDIFGTCHKQAS